MAWLGAAFGGAGVLRAPFVVVAAEEAADDAAEMAADDPARKAAETAAD